MNDMSFLDDRYHPVNHRYFSNRDKVAKLLTFDIGKDIVLQAVDLEKAEKVYTYKPWVITIDPCPVIIDAGRQILPCVLISAQTEFGNRAFVSHLFSLSELNVGVDSTNDYEFGLCTNARLMPN